MLGVNPFVIVGTLGARYVLCLFSALSPSLPATQEGRYWCPHFAYEDPETREVRDPPEGPPLILG